MTELNIQTCVYYRVVTNGGFREKRRQHRYDVGGLYLQYTYKLSFMSFYNPSKSVISPSKEIDEGVGKLLAYRLLNLNIDRQLP